jgi:large subunit ribosomal protein L6
MSKIGRKPIDISGVTVDLKGQEVHFKGPKSSGVYFLPESLTATIEGDAFLLTPSENTSLKKREVNREWGMHRALLSNEIVGSRKEFEKLVEIVGLGYKANISGNKIVFTLGYSHKIDFVVPKGVTITADKSGQKLTASSASRELLGQVCSDICALRRPEPYKGTGVKLSTEHIVRKAAKGK